MAELDDGGGLDREVGVDAYCGVGVEVYGVEGGVAEAGGGTGGGELLEALLQGGGLGGEREGGGEECGGGEQAADGARDSTHS